MGAVDQGFVNQGFIATLLLSVVWFVLMVGAVMVIWVMKHRGRRKPAATMTTPTAKPRTTLHSSPGFRNSTLRRPACWLAIKNKNLLAVQQALALHNPKPCSWAEGLSGGEQKVFVAPPVSGWILVIGSALPEPNDDVDVCFRFLLDLSRKLGQVQFFSANSMLNYHAWAQVDSGHVVRAYAWAGKTLWNQGRTTQAETDLGMKCYGYTETPDISPFGSSEGGTNNADRVHFLAARWSIDPEDIDERFIEQEWGIVGEPTRHF